MPDDKRRILVVDNEIDICNFIKRFFEERGFLVMTALNGEEAVTVLNGHLPDVVLLDVRMRWESEGLEYLPKIRTRCPSAKVILVTGLEDELTLERAKQLGADSYMTKPLLLESLENMVLGSN